MTRALALAGLLAFLGSGLSAQADGAASEGAPQAAAPAAPTAADAASPAPVTEGEAMARPGFGAWIASPRAYRPEMGLVFISNLDPLSGVETYHLITNTFGFGLEYAVDRRGIIVFEPGLTAYGNYYTLSAAGKAVPCGAELRDVYMVGLVLDLPFLCDLRLGPSLHISVGGGLALHLRVGIKAAPDIGVQDDPSDDDAVLAAINSYYWSMGRFFLPSTMVRIEYAAKEKLSFGVAVKAYWPIFNFWALDGRSDFDQMILGVAITARFAR